MFLNFSVYISSYQQKKNKTMQGNHKDIFDMQNQYNILSKLEHSLTVKLTIMLIIWLGDQSYHLVESYISHNFKGFFTKG